MKISEMSAKTSIEVNDDDVLIIEDEEDTKRITVRDFRTFLMQNDGVENTVKQYFNQGIDKIITALNEAKLIVRTEKIYNVAVFIKNKDHGNENYNYIEYAFYDRDSGTWLTKADIKNLITIDIDDETGESVTRNFSFKVEVTADDTEATIIYSSKDEEHIITDVSSNEDGYKYPDELYPSTEEDAETSESAGLIKVCFTELAGEQKMVHSIRFNRITIRLPQDEIHKYIFVCDEDKFDNEVPFPVAP